MSDKVETTVNTPVEVDNKDEFSIDTKARLNSIEKSLKTTNNVLLGALLVIGIALISWFLNMILLGYSFRDSINEKVNNIEKDNVRIEDKIEFLDEKINLLRDSEQTITPSK